MVLVIYLSIRIWWEKPETDKTPSKEVFLHRTETTTIHPQHKGRKREGTRLGHSNHDCLHGGNFLTLMQLVGRRLVLRLLESGIFSISSSPWYLLELPYPTSSKNEKNCQN